MIDQPRAPSLVADMGREQMLEVEGGRRLNLRVGISSVFFSLLVIFSLLLSL